MTIQSEILYNLLPTQEEEMKFEQIMSQFSDNARKNICNSFDSKFAEYFNNDYSIKSKFDYVYAIYEIILGETLEYVETLEDGAYYERTLYRLFENGFSVFVWCDTTAHIKVSQSALNAITSELEKIGYKKGDNEYLDFVLENV